MGFRQFLAGVVYRHQLGNGTCEYQRTAGLPAGVRIHLCNYFPVAEEAKADETDPGACVHDLPDLRYFCGLLGRCAQRVYFPGIHRNFLRKGCSEEKGGITYGSNIAAVCGRKAGWKGG